MTEPPQFVQVDLAAIRLGGPLRLGQAIVAGLLAFRPEATTAELARWLGIDERVIRRWRAGVEGRWPKERDARTPATGLGKPASGSRPSGRRKPREPASGSRPEPDACSTSLPGENGKERVGEAPTPSVRDELKRKKGDIDVLVQAYLERTIHRVAPREVRAVIRDDLAHKRYEKQDAAAYLDATPDVRAWPRELAEAVGTWSNTLHVDEAKRREMAAWSAWRHRLQLLHGGEALWEKNLERFPWSALSVDPEAGVLVVGRRDPEGHLYKRVLGSPNEGSNWIFEVETTPLLVARGAEAAKERT